MLRDLRLAFRSLRSWRLGAVAAILTLAVGIGSATSMYALVRMALTSTIPDVDDLPSLGRIYASSRTLGVERSPLTLKDVTLLAAASSFDSIGAYTSADSEMTTGDQPLPISVGQVSDGFFRAMRAHAATGRLLSLNDFREGAQVVVVSDRIWRAHFAGRTLADAVLTIDGTPRTVVGVLPPTFGFPFIGISADAWVPLAPGATGAERRVSVLARLKPGVTWTAAAAELEALARPQNPNGLWTWSAITADQDIGKRTTGGFVMMFGPALIVLLIGCTNVACMLLARGIDRDVELSVRSALGATRWRVMRQLIAESMALAIIGGVLGSALAYALLRIVAAAIAQLQPEAVPLVPSAATLLPIGVAFSIAACVIFGMLPALRLSRRDIAGSLKGSPGPIAGRFVGYGARDLVVFVEVGAAVALVVTTALFVRFFVELQRITPLFPADRVVVVGFPTRDAAAAAERIAAVPGVSAVAAAADIPGGQRASRAAWVRSESGRASRAAVIGVDSSFFATLGLPILRGRSFDPTEIAARPDVAVVGEVASARLWPAADPIGARVTITTRTGTSTATVIGVSRDVLDAGSLMRTGLLAPDIYLPLDREATPELLLFAQTSADARGMVKAGACGGTGKGGQLRVSGQHLRCPPDRGIRRRRAAARRQRHLRRDQPVGRAADDGVRGADGDGLYDRAGAADGPGARGQADRRGRQYRVIGTVLVTRSAFVEMLVISGSGPRIWIAVAGLCGGAAAIAVTFATWRIVKLDPWEVLRRL